MNYRRAILMILSVCTTVFLYAGKWTTHFAYNNVTQIAMSDDQVFALSDGSIYSVGKQDEQIRVYNNQSGLHGTGITCIHYDQTGKQLIIGYGTGKIDILTSGGVQYISELYTKDMTQRKTIYNITINGRTAYLATAYGIQTLDLRERKLVDSYWLRPGGEEIDLKDVLLARDSIYAFTDDSLFCASVNANLVDYRVWKREPAGRVSRDSEKGIHYQDATSDWYAGHGEGIVRYSPTGRRVYKPQGPLVNKPYYISFAGNQIFMLAGGRWTSQNNERGHVMRYVNRSWTNIHEDSIRAQAGVSKTRDMMNVAVDPLNSNHYFITSYGTGLYEFLGNRCVNHTTANGVITSAVSSNPTEYTRLIGAQYDCNGRLWFLNTASPTPIIVKDGNSFYGIPLVIEEQPLSIEIPCDILIDKRNEQYKWVGIACKKPGLALLDDHGTPEETSDDRTFFRGEWVNQAGRSFKPVYIYAMMQDRQGRVWIATEQGAAYIDGGTDFFLSDAIVQPDVTDDNGENPVREMKVKALCQSQDGHIWIGTESLGVFELNEAATEILAHYTTDNSAMSANSILSLTSSSDGHLWIGTAEGLVEYDPNGPSEGLNEAPDTETAEDEGSMQRWKLHLSYSNPTEIAATPKAIYAIANGSLFSIDRADNEIVYWSKANGLNGTGIIHIAYDPSSGKLIIAYGNGHVDLIDENGEVSQMPDISMKAGSMALTINDICIGTKQTYLAMPFGIIAIHPRKGEVSDTYYIGEDAASIEVQQIVEKGDSLYAFSFDRIYRASLNDNLVDFSFWSSDLIPFEQIQQAEVHNGQIYVLAHDSLYRQAGAEWKLVTSEPLEWIHASGRQLLTYQNGKGLFRLMDDDTFSGLSDHYTANDAVYTNGEYWLAEEDKGLVRLSSSGDESFHPVGPLSNFGYHLDIAHDQLYVSPGGRWATQYGRQSSLSIYDGTQWRGIPWQNTWYYTGHDIRDAVGYGVDASDPGHFYVTTFGTGVFEFRNYNAVKHYDSSNSTLRPVTAETSDYYFTRTDGAMMDEQGNLWLLNATETGKPVHIVNPSGIWYGLNLLSGGKELKYETPTGIWPDRRHSQWKWLMSQRVEPMLILLDDGGTPTISGDDRCVARSSFVDQNGNVLTPTQLRCFAQDQTNRIWIGTDKGLILIPEEVDFFSSNACRRIITPRNDGTGLGDYLLGDEQINCLAVDGGNRIWIGTANSGLYLIEDDTITVAHFTEYNSLLPSNGIQSIAIMPKTGEVFVGTNLGIASYRSDASEAQPDMSGAYAFPNPVRPNYSGMISICGLMENTTVNIIDAGGNLVCKTKSHGGIAVWDGRLPDGRKATPGVYSAMCNANGGHTVVKIMVIR